MRADLTQLFIKVSVLDDLLILSQQHPITEVQFVTEKIKNNNRQLSRLDEDDSSLFNGKTPKETKVFVLELRF